jgi:hypothetical protein
MNTFQERNKSLPVLNNPMIRVSNNVIIKEQIIINSDSAANLSIICLLLHYYHAEVPIRKKLNQTKAIIEPWTVNVCLITLS